jgi:surfeit locus 1 family protein
MRMAGAVPGRVLVPILGLTALAFLFGRLGMWQLERADETREIRAKFASGTDGEALHDLPRELDDADRFRRIEVRGSYLTRPQFLLDNMLDHGRVGYQVLTPLRVEDRTPWLLVNRGFVPAGPSRATLPEIPVETGARQITGRLERLPRPGFRVGEAVPPTGGADVAVVEFPTADDLAAAAGHPFYGYQLLLDADERDGFDRDWQPPGPSPERNLAYAGQWLLLAVGAAVAAVAILVKRWRAA